MCVAASAGARVAVADAGTEMRGNLACAALSGKLAVSRRVKVGRVVSRPSLPKLEAAMKKELGGRAGRTGRPPLAVAVVHTRGGWLLGRVCS